MHNLPNFGLFYLQLILELLVQAHDENQTFEITAMPIHTGEPCDYFNNKKLEPLNIRIWAY